MAGALYFFEADEPATSAQQSRPWHAWTEFESNHLDNCLIHRDGFAVYCAAMTASSRSFSARRSVVLFVLLVTSYLLTGQPLAAAEDEEFREEVYGLVVADGQSVAEALAALASNRPVLKGQVLKTLESGTIAGGHDAAQEIRTGPVTSSRALEPDETLSAMASSPTFEGSMTITGYDCTSRGCTAVSTLTHNSIFDLGYTTYRVTGKTSGSRTNWTGISATGFCNWGGPHRSCSATHTYPSGANWASKIFNFNVTMGGKTARVNVTFNASWRGSPGGLSGWTPYFTCNSTSKTCKFS